MNERTSGENGRKVTSNRCDKCPVLSGYCDHLICKKREMTELGKRSRRTWTNDQKIAMVRKRDLNRFLKELGKDETVLR